MGWRRNVFATGVLAGASYLAPGTGVKPVVDNTARYVLNHRGEMAKAMEAADAFGDAMRSDSQERAIEIVSNVMNAKTLSAEDRRQVFKKYAFSLELHVVRSQYFDTGISHWEIKYTSKNGHKVTAGLNYCAQPDKYGNGDESYPGQNSGYYGQRAYLQCEESIRGFEALIKVAEQQQMYGLVEALNKGLTKVHDPRDEKPNKASERNRSNVIDIDNRESPFKANMRSGNGNGR